MRLQRHCTVAALVGRRAWNQERLLADRSLESGCCSEDSSDGEPDLSSSVPGLGLGLGFFFLKLKIFFFKGLGGLGYDDRVRPITVSPS